MSWSCGQVREIIARVKHQMLELVLSCANLPFVGWVELTQAWLGFAALYPTYILPVLLRNAKPNNGRCIFSDQTVRINGQQPSDQRQPRHLAIYLKVHKLEAFENRINKHLTRINRN